MNNDSQDLSTRNYSIIEYSFKASQFMNYLSNVGRSNKCPICPHEGEWIFYTEMEGEDPSMLIYKLAQALNVEHYTPCALMECPRCGFVVHTSLINVHAHFQIGESDEH